MTQVEVPAAQADTVAPLPDLPVPILDAATVRVAQGQQSMMADIREYLHSQQLPHDRLDRIRVLEVPSAHV